MAYILPNTTVEDQFLVKDIVSGNYVQITGLGATTDDRKFTVDLGDADRVLDINGDVTFGGTFTTAGAFTTSGANPLTFITTGATSVTIPAGSGETLATQTYVNDAITGLDVKDSCQLSSLSAEMAVATATFSAPTLTITGLPAGATRGEVDGVEPGIGDRILLKDMADASGAAGTSVFNGIWVVTGGTTTDELTLTRATDADEDLEVTNGLFTFVTGGTINGGNGWVLVSDDPLVVGTDALVFAQFSGAGQITAGNGIAKSGNTISVDLNAVSGLTLASGSLAINPKPNGGIVFETNTLAVDLGAASITGTLAITDGGTGATTLEGATIVTQATAAAGAGFIPTSAGSTRAIQSTSVAIDGSQNISGLNNITAGGTLTLGPTNPAVFTVSAQAASRVITVPVLAAADTFVFQAHTQNLSNKTLLDPIINDALHDVNDNEMIIFSPTASAVNEFTLANAATGGNPTVSASGGDANIGLDLSAKGTGSYNLLGTASNAATVRLFENTVNGTNSVGVTAAALMGADYAITLPAAVGASGQVLQTVDGAGTLGWATVAGAGRRGFQITSIQVEVTSDVATTIAYFPWNDTLYGDSTSVTISAYVVTALNSCDIVLHDGTGVIASATQLASTTGIATATAAFNPGADKRLEIRVSRGDVSSTKANRPNIYGITLEFF